MDDEIYYLEATKEFESGAINEALWAKLIALAVGDETKAKYQYIQSRAAELLTESELVKHDEPVTASVANEYISTEEFALKNNTTEGHVLDLIRGGHIEGKKVSDELFVSGSLATKKESTESPGFFKQYINGDLGLAKTYWIFCVGANILFNLLFKVVDNESFIFVLVGVVLIYYTALVVALWRAADKYSGLKIWAFLARCVVWILVLSGAFLLVGLFGGL